MTIMTIISPARQSSHYNFYHPVQSEESKTDKRTIRFKHHNNGLYNVHVNIDFSLTGKLRTLNFKHPMLNIQIQQQTKHINEKDIINIQNSPYSTLFRLYVQVQNIRVCNVYRGLYFYHIPVMIMNILIIRIFQITSS